MRRDGEDNLTLLALLGLLAKQVLQNRNLCDPWISTHGVSICVIEYAPNQVHFAVCEPRLMFDPALSNGWLTEAAYVLYSGN